MSAVATTIKLNRKTRRRVEKVLRYLDGEASDAMVALYVQSALENEGSLEAALKLDEREAAEEGFEG